MRRILQEEGGEITVYLSLIFLVVLGVGMSVLEGMHMYLNSTHEEEALIGAGEAVLANYDRELFSMYHVLFTDPRETDYMTEDAQDYVNRYYRLSGIFGRGCRGLQVSEDLHAADLDGRIVKKQILEWMDQQPSPEENPILTDLVRTGSETPSFDLAYRARDPVAGEEDSLSEEDGEESLHVPEELTVYNRLLSSVRGVMAAGITSACMDEDEGISGLEVDRTGYPSALHGIASPPDLPEPVVSFTEGGISDLPSGSFRDPHTSARVLSYIHQHYASYICRNEKHPCALNYQREYLIGGRSSDQENLTLAVRKIFSLRLAANYSCAAGDEGLCRQAGQIAEKVCGMQDIPSSAEVTQKIVLAALAYGESVLEVRTLLAGGKVQADKRADTWSFGCTSTDIMTRSEGYTGEGAAGYEDYLDLFLLEGQEEKDLCYRMMDMMQADTALKEPGFALEDCLYSFRVSADYGLRFWFTGIGSGSRRYSMEKVMSY